jgi:type IV pilus assembly protein PilB
VDLGVEPVLLADSLLGLSAQRLVKKVCTHCSSEIAFKDSGHKIEGFLDEDIIKVANPEGCKQCNEGYSDRIIINEITEIDSDTRQKIAVGSTVDEILKGAANNGFERLSDDAIIKVKSGQTTIEQVINIL